MYSGEWVYRRVYIPRHLLKFSKIPKCEHIPRHPENNNIVMELGVLTMTMACFHVVNCFVVPVCLYLELSNVPWTLNRQ